MEQNRLGWNNLLLPILIVAGVFALIIVPSIYGDYLWFVELGYDSVFLTILGYQIGVFLVVTVVSFLALSATYFLAIRNVQETEPISPSSVYLAGLLALSGLIGIRYTGAWDVVLRFMNGVPFGVTDPAYGQEVAFYVYTLPFVNVVVSFLMLLAVVALVLTLVVYARFFGFVEHDEATGETAFDVAKFLGNFRRRGFGHVSAIIGVFLVLLGIGYFVDRYELVYSTRGAVFGVGATDQTIFQPLLLLLTVTAILGGLALIANVWLRDDRIFYIPIALIIGFLIVGTAGGAAYQSFVVEPDEFNKEASFIENEIEFTNDAFALDRVDDREFPVNETISASQIEDNPGTIDNVRLWDSRPIMTTYNELQIFRTYYRFWDVDIDRYEIDGQERQVMISPREIDFDALPADSQTWVNRHLVYTHGYGVAMSPVTNTTGEGLPELYIRDIPPETTNGPELDQPRIYYGDNTESFNVVNTKTRELDYPSGNQNVYTNYEGDGGVPLNSVFRELIYTAKFASLPILLSDSITAESRLQFNRDLESRAGTITPFLEFDDDPYIVVANGKLYWIYDAYTTTDRYPYSRQVDFKGDSTNYVRNSVKIVVDAHTGETTYYVADEDDPLIQTYRSAFPSLFEDLDQMPPEIEEHIRYPQDAFQIQANMYLDYHMEDPNVFYNKEDAWRIPNEVTRGQQMQMEPYYIIMKFPDGDEPEFVMIQPYIPDGRENMIGWLAARSDPPNYGELRAYHFSKQRLVFGPMQIESRIDQDTNISQRITLWSQAGSTVIRGNLLAIPIDDTILYVEPLFLESDESGALPELKRVIVAQGDSLTMQPTFEQALAVRFGIAPVEGPVPVGPGTGVTPGDLERLQTLYDEAQAALQRGDFQTYADRITEIGEKLDELERQQSVNGTTPNATAEGP